MEGAEELRRQIQGHAGEEIGAADITHEEGVPAEDHCRFSPPGVVNNHVGNMLRGVPRRFQDLDLKIINPEAVPLGNGMVLEFAVAGLGRNDDGPGGLCQVQMP